MSSEVRVPATDPEPPEKSGGSLFSRSCRRPMSCMSSEVRVTLRHFPSIPDPIRDSPVATTHREALICHKIEGSFCFPSGIYRKFVSNDHRNNHNVVVLFWKGVIPMGLSTP